MRKICIIPTGKPKIWDKLPHIGSVIANDAYTGTFHRLAKAYAEHFFNDWYMISPKHGFISKNHYIEENYDLTLNAFTKEQLQEYITLLLQQKEQILGKPDLIIVLGGKKFHSIFDYLYKDQPNVSVQFPLEGASGIGVMQQKLKNAVQNGHKLH